MKLAVLFSGGKDSCLAMQKAMQHHEIVCLVSILSKNKESYMFHVPNIELTKAQAEAIGLPIIQQETEGRKEEELKDLKKVLERAKKECKIGGVVTGAIRSNYQASRVQKICEELGLKSINPLWLNNPEQCWKDLLENNFEIVISSVSAEGLGKEWLGKKIGRGSFNKLKNLSKKFRFHLGFEGGEAETLVIDCPFFKKKIKIINARTEFNKGSGIYVIEEIKLVDK